MTTVRMIQLFNEAILQSKLIYLMFMFVTGAQVCSSCQTCDPQSTTPGTCAAGSISDMMCSCSIGYYGDGYVCNPCKSCAGHAAKYGSPCATGNTADTVICACDAGYAGDGTVCTDSGSQSSETASLIILVILPMTLAEFVMDEDKYIIIVATTASVPTSSVKILNVTTVSTRRTYGSTKRSLMSTSVQLKTSIYSTTDNEIQLNQATLNAILMLNGLPIGTLTIISNMSVPTSTSSQEVSSSERSTSLSVGVIVGIAVISVLFMAIIGLGIWKVKYLNLPVETSI